MNVQEIAKALGESGCYFISLLKVVGREDDAIKLFRQALSQGLIDEDCYVKNPSGLLSLAVGGAWSVRHGRSCPCGQASAAQMYGQVERAGCTDDAPTPTLPVNGGGSYETTGSSMMS